MKVTNMDWILFPFCLPNHLRCFWYVFLVCLSIELAHRQPPLCQCSPGEHITRPLLPCHNNTPGLYPRRQYSRSELLAIPSSSSLDPDVVDSLRSCGIGFRLPKKRTHRGGRRKVRSIDVLVTPPPTDTNVSPVPVYDHPTGPDFRNLISIPFSPVSKPSTIDNLRVATFNAQSVQLNAEKRAEIASFVVDGDVDILFLTETWLRQHGDEARCRDLAPAGYTAVSFPRLSRGGGIAVVFRDCLAKRLTTAATFPFQHPSFEAVRLTLLLPSISLHFVCVYRPPPSRKNKLTVAMFLNDFSSLLDFCNTLSGSCLILGDVNVHFDSQSDPVSVKMKSFLDMFNFSQAVTEPTQNCGHILDWVVFRPTDNIVRSTHVTHSLSSDHYCVVAELFVTLPSDAVEYIESRNVRAIDSVSFSSDLRTLVTPDLCPSIDHFGSALVSVLDKHAPLRRRKVRANRLEPWFAAVKDDLGAAKKHRRWAERRWIKNPITITKHIFNTAKKAVSKIILKAKSLFYLNEIASATSKKKLFSVCDRLLGRRKKKSSLPTTYPLNDLPAVFNKFFLDKVQSIRNELDQATLSPMDKRPTSPSPTSTFSMFQPVTESDLKTIILKSKPTSCPLDPVPTPLLLKFLDDLLPILTEIINSSLSSGLFPLSLKTAVVKPLLKKQSLDPNNLKNYRPISNLSFVSKILEKVALQQLLTHLNDHNLFSPSQSAYRPHHSTETALLKISNDILLALDSGNVSLLTLLDLSAAFDTIDHTILLFRLQHNYGISHTALSWFQSYLTDRTQSVIVNNLTSSSEQLLYGVPQGSVLGPVLFVLYTQPLSDLIQSHSPEHQLFADDTQLEISTPPENINSCISSLELCISDIRIWMLVNKLKLNDDKTEAILHSSSVKSLPSNTPASLSVGSNDVTFSSTARNLGFYFSKDMSINTHVQTICRKVYIDLRRISSIRHLLSEDATKTLVSAFILSKLDYCNSLFSGSPQNQLDKLQKVQNSAAKLVSRSRKRNHVTPILKSLHWLPVKARIEYKLASLCHSFFSDLSPRYFADLLTVYIPSRILRSASDSRLLCVPRVRTKTFGQRSFSFAAPAVWNSLPFHIRHIKSTSSFKSALKTHLFQKNYV